MSAAKKVKRLNVQGLARGDKGLMSCLLPEPGNTIISCDFASGEPTITTHFSGDANYRAATFDMVGKAPFYKGGILYIDDLYLMVMSTSPIGAKIMRDAFEHRFDGGKSFQDKWLEPGGAEWIQKTFLKKPRKLHKGLALGLGYSMGPKKLVKTAKEAGEIITLTDAKGFFRSYWDTFPDVRRFADRLEAQLLQKGHLINPFGYRLVPDKSHKAFNHFIQSSVSGAIDLLGAKVDAAAPYADFLALIHDELLYEVPTPRVEEFRHHMAMATESLNGDLKWSVKMRTGFAPGNNWYEAK